MSAIHVNVVDLIRGFCFMRCSCLHATLVQVSPGRRKQAGEASAPQMGHVRPLIAILTRKWRANFLQNRSRKCTKNKPQMWGSFSDPQKSGQQKETHSGSPNFAL